MTLTNTAKALVLIPSYNEELTLGSLLKSLLHYVSAANILVIDDGSTDKTTTIADRWGINLIRNSSNLGRNNSIVRGMIWGIMKGYSHFICIDADGQHSPTEIPRIMREISRSPELDCIIMSRFTRMSMLRALPIIDALGVIVSSFFVSISSGVHISDPTTGFIVLSKKAANCIIKNHSLLSSISSDSTWALAQYPLFSRCGIIISELETKHIPRISGDRKMFTPSKQMTYPIWLIKSLISSRLFLNRVIYKDC